MRLKVPPVAVFAVAAILLYAGAWLLPQSSLVFPGQTFLSLFLAFAGLIPGGRAVLAFARKKTTVNPVAPEKATVLVTGGIYRISRNPMYLGLLCLLLALAVYWGSLTALVIVPAFVWYMTEFQIKPEEEALTALFGDAYKDYCTRVRRWI
ncbi:methyltransferase family protein [Roseibium sp.]|uniref:methyltransferase family protein n=1 Tax=Roseibium sp. TaxID=1936156 RepID=UPI003D0C6088